MKHQSARNNPSKSQPVIGTYEQANAKIKLFAVASLAFAVATVIGIFFEFLAVTMFIMIPLVALPLTVVALVFTLKAKKIPSAQPP